MKEIMEKIMNSPDLLARYRALNANYAAGLAEIARDAGFRVTDSEIAAEIAAAEGALSDEALGEVAGGHSVASCGRLSSFV